MKSSKMIRRGSLFIILLMIFLLLPGDIMAAQAPVFLGSAESYAVLAYSTITIVPSGMTTINGKKGGDVGVYPGISITGLTNATISGTIHTGDANALAAQTDLLAAYTDAAGRKPVTRIDTELGGRTLKPGVYDSADGTFEITGTLTLDAEGDPDGVFVFLTASTLVTASNSNIALLNSARFCRIFWKVGSSATLGTNSYFVGHILADASITATTGATVEGQLLAMNGAVTLDNNTITNGFCEAAATPTPTETTAATPTPAGTTAVPTTAATPTPTETTAATPTPAATTAVPTTAAPPTSVPPAAAPPTAVPPTVTVTTETVVDTGESGNIIFIVIGVIMIGLAGSLLLLALRRSRR